MTGLLERIEILNTIGGLPLPEVVNREWLYILKEETRNSILIEGVFVSEDELEEVLAKKNEPMKKNQIEAFNYYRAAKYFYELAFQGLQTGEFMFNIAIVRQINKMLLEGIDGNGGGFRRGGVVIAGAKISPPSGVDINQWMQIYKEYVIRSAGNPDKDLLRDVAVQHILFESMHPFSDGNGRTGRIIMNYLLVSRGIPPVILKGDDVSRARYYRALEIGDQALLKAAKDFPGMEKAFGLLPKINSLPMEEMVSEAARVGIDRMIISILETREGLELKPSRDVARTLGLAPDSIRTLINRGKFVAAKRGKDWYTHEDLGLEALGKRFAGSH